MDQWITVAEAADLLKISRKHVRRLINAGKLPGIRLSDRVYRIDRLAIASPEKRGGAGPG